MYVFIQENQTSKELDAEAKRASEAEMAGEDEEQGHSNLCICWSSTVAHFVSLTLTTVIATEVKHVEEAAEAKSVEENAAKDGQLPLHYAAEKGTSLEVMKLLLEANTDAVTLVDEARYPT